MRILLVEDEGPAARRLEKMIKELDPSYQVLGSCDSIESTIKWFQNHEAPDLVCMDIELADGQSFEIFNRIEVPCPVVFTTAYDEFALKAFKVNSIDYLLKPIDLESLAFAIDKFKNQYAQSRLQAQTVQDLVSQIRTSIEQPAFKHRFLIKTGDRLLSLSILDILFFFSEDKLNFLYTRDGKKYMIDYTLDEIEKSIDPALFFRLNRSYIACIESIKSIHSHFNGKLKIVLQVPQTEEIYVSREKASAFKTWLGS